MSVLMRRAKVGDLDAIMQLERATFVTDAWSEETMRRELEGPHGYYLVAVDDDADDPERRLLGYAGLLAPAGAGQGDIQTIAVAPFARGIGLGRGLMHALITQARRKHVGELFLEVRASRHLGHDAAVAGVLLHRGGDDVGEQGGAAHDADPGLVAGRLDAEHQWLVPNHVSLPVSPFALSSRPSPGRLVPLRLSRAW